MFFLYSWACVPKTQILGLYFKPTIEMNLSFTCASHTEFGQSLWISGNINELGTMILQK